MNIYRFTKAHNPSKCKYMRILEVLMSHPNGLCRTELLQLSHGVTPPNDGWCSSTFSALHHYGYASFSRKGRECIWHITYRGKMFYNAFKNM